MFLKSRAPWLFVAFSSLALASPAVAGSSNDAAASKLLNEAIYQDYLETRFPEAREKLVRGLSLCVAAPDCTPATRAHLRCALGVVEFALQKRADARAEFAAAIREDPTISIDHDLSTPDLEKEFAAVKQGTPVASQARKAPGAGGDAGQGSTDSADCPPGFPGCRDPSSAEAACRSDDDCPNGETCKGASCQSPNEPVPDGPFKRSWLSATFEADALFLPTAKNACAGGTGYTCFSGSDYYGALPLAGADDLVNGGLRLATPRVLLGYDFAVDGNITLGARLGYAFGGGPQRPTSHPFEPIHAEIRGSFWIGHDPLARSGPRFFVTAAGGMAEIDASIPVDAYPSRQAYDSGQSQNFVAWKKTGLGFAALGPGMMYALTPDSGILLEVKVMQMFPTAGTALALQLGYAIGL